MINCPVCGAEMNDEVLVCPECGEGEKRCLTLKLMPDAMRRVFFMIEDEDGIEMFKTVTNENIKVFLGGYGTEAAVPIKKGFTIMPKYTIKFDEEDIILKQTAKTYTTTWDGISAIIEEDLGYKHKFLDKNGRVMATMKMRTGAFKISIETNTTDFRLLCIMAIMAEGMHKIRVARPSGI